MSSAGISGGGDGGAAATACQYYCYKCERHVAVVPPSSPTADVVCPNCGGGFLEESDPETAAPIPDNPIPNPFFADAFPASSPFGGFPIVFSSSSPGANAFSFSSGGGGGFEDLSALFGARSPDEFNPFSFLNNYINGLQSRGANIQVVFEGPRGGAAGMGGGGVDFRLPMNFGDYFIGPGLEQLIQQLAENDPNRYGTPPASKTAVKGLPDISITQEMLASDSSQCAVCKDSFGLKEVAKQMPCKHIYHKDCILPWLELHNSCPVCRYELPTDDPDYESRRTGQNSGNGNRNRGNDNNSNNNQENRGNDNNNNNSNSSPQAPRTTERGFRISFPWIFRGLGSQAGTSNNGGGGNGNNGGGNGNNSTNSDRGGSSTGQGRGGQAREEDLD
ncbi:RING/U-box superfamily protein [Striga asiatica]|uniref:RING-type E3 ubiquitin transferase n=1 Tax=Striga asiatica TaxID=4170 RepID=A0A5A7Q0S5_STRAF|nr:RING/U-box superfamily protein [Striga asiatica]